MIFLDTDHFTVAAQRHHSQYPKLSERLKNATDPIFLPVITVEEQLHGWLEKLHAVRNETHRIAGYTRLVKLLEILPEWDIVPWDEVAVEEFDRQRRAGVRIGSQDLRIASLAISHDALLLTRNAKDFSRVLGLRFESWLD